MKRLKGYFAASCAALIVAACSQPEQVEITERLERSDYEAPAKVGATSEERFSATMPAAGPMTIAAADDVSSGEPAAEITAPAPGDAPFSYTTPDGWTAQPATQFRNPNFTAGPNGEVECYVSMLPMGAGLKANADRWAEQMSMAPMTDEEFALLPRTLLLGHEAVIMDVPGTFRGMGQAAPQPEYRLIGAMVDGGDQAVFIKMVGPDAAVQTERDEFAQFAMSLQDNKGLLGTPEELPPPPAATDASSDGPFSLEWDAPEGWREETPGSPMRAVTFRFGPGGIGECYIAVLGGSGGGRLANYNRWLAQIGQAPLEEDELELQPTVTILGDEAPLLIAQGDYSGMRGDSIPDAVLLGASAEVEGRSVFVKLIAPRALGEQNREAFVQFCGSLTVAE